MINCVSSVCVCVRERENVLHMQGAAHQREMDTSHCRRGAVRVCVIDCVSSLCLCLFLFLRLCLCVRERARGTCKVELISEKGLPRTAAEVQFM